MPTDSRRRDDSPPPANEDISPDTADLPSKRTPGIDVARAFALLGMVLVNYKIKLEAGGRGPEWMMWASARLDGRAAALFVVLAGVGISLRSKCARLDPKRHLPFERTALLKRAAVLFVVGLVHRHLWDWDILHFYGVFLAAAAPLLIARGWVLWLVAAASVAVAVWLQVNFDYYHEPDFWTAAGAPTLLLFNGLHPFFPWFAFLVVGMWVGRLDLNDDATRKRLLMLALLVAGSAELVDTIAAHACSAGAISERTEAWLSSRNTPPCPGYVFAAAGTAVCIICLCIKWARARPQASWVVALMATGQLAFTLYILHAVCILIPLAHGWFKFPSLGESISYSLGFYGAGMALSLWWRRRFAYGPLELVIRQITGRVGPASWGGQLVGTTKE